MSEQYAKKKISDIQKSITFWELEWIHDEVAKKLPISIGEIAHSNEDKKIKINLDLEIPKFESANGLPLTSNFITGNISINEIEKTKVWLLKNEKSIDQVHLWEIYYAIRKKIIIESFTIVFIFLISALLFASPYIFECFPIQSENKYNKQKITNDTLIIINETVNLI